MHARYKNSLKCNSLRPCNLCILPKNSYDIAAEIFRECISNSACYGTPFAKKLYLTDLAQKVLSLRIYSYLCTDLIISAQR